MSLALFDLDITVELGEPLRVSPEAQQLSLFVPPVPPVPPVPCPKGRIRQSEVLALWTSVVDSRTAACSQAVSARKQVLTVLTKSCQWSHELAMKKQDLIQHLNNLLGAELIIDIRFRSPGTPWPATEALP